MSNETRVFVYGTLKAGHGNHPLLAESELLGRHCIEGGYTLLDLGPFPGVVATPSSVGKVYGEVYRVDEPTLHSLDLLEGHPSFYERIKISTPWKGTWIYLLGDEYLQEDGANVVDGGAWQPEENERHFIAATESGDAAGQTPEQEAEDGADGND